WRLQRHGRSQDRSVITAHVVADIRCCRPRRPPDDAMYKSRLASLTPHHTQPNTAVAIGALSNNHCGYQIRRHGGTSRGNAGCKVVFSGIQPTGIPHLGNYAGALRQWVQLQHQEPPDTKLIYSIVDLHAMTTPQEPNTLRLRKRETLATLLAIGIDPERSVMFYQSS
ncbi:hypothetical protein E4U35_000763, partial [Claviceps purpurea]